MSSRPLRQRRHPDPVDVTMPPADRGSGLRRSSSKEPLLPGVRLRTAAAAWRRGTLVAAAAVALALTFVALLAAAGAHLAPASTAQAHAWHRAKRRRAAASAAGAGKPGELRFLTYNAFMRPVPVGVGDYQAERLPALARAVGDNAVAMTQEIFWLSLKKGEFLSRLAERGMPYFAAAPMPGLAGLARWPPKLVDGGLTITSVYPIEESDAIVYEATVLRSIDAIVAKGALYAKANNGLDGAAFANVRASQQAQLAEFVLSKAGPGNEACPIVVGGDFNSDGRRSYDDGRSSDEYGVLWERLRVIPRLVDVLYEAHGQRHPVTSAGGLDGATQKNERLDYMFFAPTPNGTSGLRVSERVPPAVVEFWTDDEALKAKFRSASDHFGVEVTMVADR